MTEITAWSEVVKAALATVAALLVTLLLTRKGASKSLPPGPRGWPILGSLPLLGTMPHESLSELSKQYGPLILMRLGSVKTLVVTSPKFAEEILKTHNKTMSSKPVHVVPTEIFYNASDIGWTAECGQHWRYLRKVCTVGLLTTTRLNQFKELREREVTSILHYILEESQRGNAVDMTECLSIINMNNMTQMMMNQSYLFPGRALANNSFPIYVKEMFQLLGTFNLADYVPVLKPFDPQGLRKKAKALHRNLDKLITEIVEEHRQTRLTGNTENHKEDFVDALLRFGETQEFDKRLSMDSIKALVLDMISGATDTSSTTALWALSALLKHPQVLRKAQEELDSVVGPDRLVQEDDLSRLPYLSAVFKETLRLYSPGPLLAPRESSEDCEIGGFHIPARTRIFVNLWGMRVDPLVWERPLEFDPDRFLSSTTDFKGNDFQFIPFGAGRRMCPGINLGTLMVMYPLSVLVHALDWALPDGQKLEELDMAENFGMVLTRKVPLIVFGKARLPHHVLYPAQEMKQ
ncbi:unnamed protein product [Calypogeia fissa]